MEKREMPKPRTAVVVWRTDFFDNFTGCAWVRGSIRTDIVNVALFISKRVIEKSLFSCEIVEYTDLFELEKAFGAPIKWTPIVMPDDISAKTKR